MTLDAWLAPLHDGPHDSVGDLTASDYFVIFLLIAILAGVGFLIYRVVQRRRELDAEE